VLPSTARLVDAGLLGASPSATHKKTPIRHQSGSAFFLLAT